MLSENPHHHHHPSLELLDKFLPPRLLLDQSSNSSSLEALQRLRRSCEEGLIPTHMITTIAEAYLQVSQATPTRCTLCLDVINMLARWQKGDAEEKWLGLKNLVDVASRLQGHERSGLLATFYMSCAGISEPDAIGDAFRYARLCTVANFENFASELVVHNKPLVSPSGQEGKRVTQCLPFLLAERSLSSSWSSAFVRAVKGYLYTHPLADCLSPQSHSIVTLEGHLAREDILRNQHLLPDKSQIPFNRIRARLKSVSTCEQVIAPLRTSEEERRALMFSPQRDTLLTSLKNLLQNEQQERLLSLLARAEAAHHNLPQQLAKTLAEENKSRGKSLPEFLDQVAEFESKGLGLPLAILLSGNLRQVYDRAQHVIWSAFESEEPLFAVLKSLENYSQRVERENPGSTLDALKGALHEIAREDQDRAETILGRQQSIDKLILCLNGKGLPASETINTPKKLKQFLVELESRTEISELIHSPIAGYDHNMYRFYKRFHVDNPPFSLKPEVNPQTLQMQKRFQNQIYQTFLRREDAHYGFRANIYTMKHTPIGHRCAFDEFSAAVNGELWVLPAADVGKFPGRGRIIEGIDTSTIFTEFRDDSAWKERIFPAYGPLAEVATEGNIHAMDNLARAKITMLRAFDAVAVPSNRFFDIDGIPMTLIVSNHHFDATGAHELSLVPSQALNSFLDRVKVPYDPFKDSFPEAYDGDISVNPPTLRAIDERARDMGLRLGAIDVNSGSCFAGGFCNGPKPKSRGNHAWERRGNHTLDSFGHSHKFHIKEQRVLLERLHHLHDRIFEVTAGLMNVRDLFKFSIGMDARGTIARHHQHPDESELNLEKEGIRYGGRMLKLFCEFSAEFRERDQRNMAPVLVIAPMNRWAPEAETPLVLDGTTGFAFHQWGRPFEMEFPNGAPSQKMIDWWVKYVDPYLAERNNKWSAPRLVAKDVYRELINDYAKQ